MSTYKLYIGANNDTKQVEIDKIVTILDAYFQGYTVENCRGRWNGTNEDSISVLITADAKTLKQVLKVLKHELVQEAIAFHSVAALNFF